MKQGSRSEVGWKDYVPIARQDGRKSSNVHVNMLNMFNFYCTPALCLFQEGARLFAV